MSLDKWWIVLQRWVINLHVKKNYHSSQRQIKPKRSNIRTGHLQRNRANRREEGTETERRLIRLAYTIQPTWPSRGSLHIGKAKNLIAAQYTR